MRFLSVIAVVLMLGLLGCHDEKDAIALCNDRVGAQRCKCLEVQAKKSGNSHTSYLLTSECWRGICNAIPGALPVPQDLTEATEKGAKQPKEAANTPQRRPPEP